mgnify:CR=1 FL=1
MSWVDPKNYAPWLVVAFGELGQQELTGPKHNPRILEYHAATDLKATSEQIPWCGGLIALCLKLCGIEPPEGAATARSWLNLKIALTEPKVGAITILKRGSNPMEGHVGLYLANDDKNIVLLSGNVGNKVAISKFNINDLLGYRWPSTIT